MKKPQGRQHHRVSCSTEHARISAWSLVLLQADGDQQNGGSGPVCARCGREKRADSRNTSCRLCCSWSSRKLHAPHFLRRLSTHIFQRKHRLLVFQVPVTRYNRVGWGGFMFETLRNHLPYCFWRSFLRRKRTEKFCRSRSVGMTSTLATSVFSWLG